jgi:hypothetical protein
MDLTLVIIALLFISFVTYLWVRKDRVYKELEEMKGDSEAIPFVPVESKEEGNSKKKAAKKKSIKKAYKKSKGDDLLLS